MKKISLIVLVSVVYLFTIQIYAQEKCKVLKKDIKGEYIGGCKDGLANGNGVSKGENTYKGKFKNGLPNGRGIIIYDDGSRYTGEWKNGLRHGEGIYSINTEGKESTLEGVWKKGKYIRKGRGKKQYEIVSSRSVQRYIIRKKKNSTFNRVVIKITKDGASIRMPDNITGSGGSAYKNYNNTIFENIKIFPFTCEMRYSIASKLYTTSVPVEFNFRILEPGDWEVIVSH